MPRLPADDRYPAQPRISRREALWMLGGAVAAGAACAHGCRAPAPFDVLFIAIDDLNDWVSPLGGCPGVLETPHFERLAQRTTTFTNAHAQGVSCMSSRASVMTGMYPETTGIVGPEQRQDFRIWIPDAVTIPAHFRAGGYSARGYGKVFHYPDARSWDEDSPFWLSPKPAHRPLSGVAFPYMFDWGPLDLPASAMGDHRMTNAALDAFLEHRAGPLFLGMGLAKPHPPWYLPREFFERHPLDEVVSPAFPNDLDDVPDVVAREIPMRGYQRRLEQFDAVLPAVQGYLAAVDFVDSLVGTIVDRLDRAGAWDDTVVVVWSDHGQHLGEKGFWNKFTLWEESTRVPLFVSVPGVGSPGSRCSRAVGLIDLFPTLVEACGLAPLDQLEGQSLLPLLRDPDAPWDRAARTTWRENRALRTDRWRYIRYADGSEELYDHETDPDERTNLASAPGFEATRRELSAALDRSV